MNQEFKESNQNKRQNKERFKGGDKIPSGGETIKPYFIWLMAFIIVFVLFFISKKSEQVVKLDYSQFINLVKEKKVKTAIVQYDSPKIEGQLAEKSPSGILIQRKYITNRLREDKNLAELLLQNNVKIVGVLGFLF